MKEHVMSETANVKRAFQMINYLINRPKSELVGLGLIYGAPGLGKTRFARRMASSHGYIWMRLSSCGTTRAFVRQLFTALKYKANQMNEMPVGSTSLIFGRCLEMINDMPDTVIMLDEIDYAFHDKTLLGTIRDIVDETVGAVIMIGMKGAKNSLMKANAHYFDRCNSFCEFLPLTLADTKLALNEVSDFEIQDDLCEYIHEGTFGNLRKSIQNLYIIEKIGKMKKLTSIGLNDTGKFNVQ